MDPLDKFVMLFAALMVLIGASMIWGLPGSMLAGGVMVFYTVVKFRRYR